MGVPESVTVRGRRPADVPALAQVLAAQQAHTGYPQNWPLPYPPERFIARRGELQAWVATLGDAAAPVGHVSVTTPDSGPEADGWAAGAGRPLEELAAVSVLFVDHRVSGRGVGGALLDTAVAFIRESGRAPVLDVVQESRNAVRLYEARGWQVVGEARPWWLPANHLPVLLMVLPEAAASTGGRREQATR